MFKTHLKEPYFYGNQKHISFLTATMNAIRESKIPLYSSKFSRKDYNQHQLLALLVFKEYLGARYREIIELIEVMNVIQTHLGIARIPHFTTLNKFSSRISSTILTEVHKQATSFFYRDMGRVSTIAIDSTGFPTEYFSYYYSMRADKTRKDFIKISVAVDTEKQTILGSKITKSRQHDTKHAKPLLRNTLRKADCYVLDRGYILSKFIFRSEPIFMLNPSSLFAIGMPTMLRENLEKRWLIILIENDTVNVTRLKLFSLLLNEGLGMKLKADSIGVRLKN
jgi:hypothetical protein